MSGPLVGLQGTVVDKDAYLVEVHFAEVTPFMQQYEDSRKGRGHFQPQDLRDVPAGAPPLDMAQFTAFEFGYRCCEKGMNLQAAYAEYQKVTGGK